MNFRNIPSGKNFPEDIYVIIEISPKSKQIKYEVNKKTGKIFVDRFLKTSMFYPYNYGYINYTLAPDKDPLDVLVLSEFSIYPGTVLLSRPIGLLNMTDESGEDIKIIAVPHENITQEYNKIKEISDLSEFTKNKIIHFFQHYKDLEKNKWTKIGNWESSKIAKDKILQSHKYFYKNKKK